MSNHSNQGEGIQQQNQAAKMCKNGCGFFANAACLGYCSKCYRENADCGQQQAPPHPVRDSPRTQVVSEGGADDTAGLSAAPSLNLGSDSPAIILRQRVREPGLPKIPRTSTAPAVRPSRNRCLVCRKRVGLTGFSCKCGKLFCGEHRYAEAHSCEFDHKACERQKIAKDNPVVMAPKLDRL